MGRQEHKISQQSEQDVERPHPYARASAILYGDNSPGTFSYEQYDGFLAPTRRIPLSDGMVLIEEIEEEEGKQIRFDFHKGATSTPISFKINEDGHVSNIALFGPLHLHIGGITVPIDDVFEINGIGIDEDEGTALTHGLLDWTSAVISKGEIGDAALTFQPA